MIIGGAGSGCVSADRGIGITAADTASFVADLGCGRTNGESDFGNQNGCSLDLSQSYSLNLWTR